jgi:hypothetical protein
MLTGESRPVEKLAGQEAFGGVANGESSVVLAAQKTGDQTTPEPGHYTGEASSGDAVADPGPRRSRRLLAELYSAVVGRGNGIFWMPAGKAKPYIRCLTHRSDKQT